MRSGLFVLHRILAFCVITGCGWAQTELVRSHFFPAELEFRELQGIEREESLEESAALGKIENGPIIEELGFQRMARRVYRLGNSGTLAIEVWTLRDGRASYSALTLFRRSKLVGGPPGEYFCWDNGELQFSRGPFWVRIRGTAMENLEKRVAISVSNRIGQRAPALPTLVKDLPQLGLEASSIRYFLGPKSFESFAYPESAKFRVQSQMEIAQAHYTLQEQSGTLTLASFPTGQLAEDYFDGAATQISVSAEPGRKVYAKRAGPLVAFLQGNFDPGTADKILSSIRFTYSIRWIYDKHSRGTATIWGVPVRLLGTVVRSLVLTALLCLCSLLAGSLLALIRFALRTYAPRNPLDRPERTELIRLKIDEK